MSGSLLQHFIREPLKPNERIAPIAALNKRAAKTKLADCSYALIKSVTKTKWADCSFCCT